MDLADVPALKHMSSTQLTDFRSACSERLLAAGEELIQRGAEGGKLYVLVEGALEVYVEDNGSSFRLNELRPPAILGELELLTNRTRTASVRATSESRLLELSHQSIQARIDADDTAFLNAMYGIAQVVADRLVRVSEMLVEFEAQAEPARSHELRDFRRKLFGDWSI